MDNLVKLKSVANNIEAELIINLLKNNNIECLKKSREAGDYMNIYMGYSIFGEDIYVNEVDYQAAMDVLNSISFDDELQTDIDNSEDNNIENNIDNNIENNIENNIDNNLENYMASNTESNTDGNKELYTPNYKNPRVVARIIIFVTIAIALVSFLVGLFFS